MKCAATCLNCFVSIRMKVFLFGDGVHVHAMNYDAKVRLLDIIHNIVALYLNFHQTLYRLVETAGMQKT